VLGDICTVTDLVVAKTLASNPISL